MISNYEYLRSHPLFDDFNDSMCLEISNHIEIKEYKKHDYILLNGGGCKNIFINKKGLVKGGIYSDHGNELNSMRFHQNSIFGLSLLNDNENTFGFFYQAIEKTELIIINIDYFNTLLNSNAPFCYKIL